LTGGIREPGGALTLPIAVPRDRLATFDPQLIAKYRRRLPGFDDSEADQETIR